MIPSIQVSAPGKALILGEYAVLEGYPAMVQAVDKQARIQLCPAPDYQLTAPPLVNEPVAFYFDAEGRFQWQHDSNNQRLPFVAPLMHALGAWQPAAADQQQSWSLSLDTHDFFTPAGDKTGLGSSAALTVALAAAWFQLRHPGQNFDRRRWLPLLVQLHRNLQDGRGSGADIAASLWGGLSSYRIDGHDCRVQALSWPGEVECIWIWLGQSASTRVFLSRMDHFKASHPRRYATHLQQLGQLSERGLSAVRQGDSTQLLECLTAYGQAMQALGTAADAPVYTDAHRRLAQLASDYGVAFKPSGAGGGDIAIAAAIDTHALADFGRRVQAAGYGLLELSPAEQGVVMTTDQSFPNEP